MKLDAIIFRRILAATIVLIIALSGVGYYFLSSMLHQKTIETDHAKIDADLSHNDIEHLKALQQQLAQNADAVKRAEDIVGNVENYQYQDDFIRNINQLASETGVGVTGFTFPATATVGPGASTSAPSASTGGIVLPAGVKKLLVNINTVSPLPYENYLRFLRALELNLTRLQVTGVTLTPDGSNPKNITNSSIGVEVYVRG